MSRWWRKFCGSTSIYYWQRNARREPLGFRQFERYLEKVFSFPGLVWQLRDGRRFPRIPLPAIFQAVFFGVLLRMASIHEVERECQRGRLNTRVGAMSEDTIRYTLERVDLDSLRQLGVKVVQQLKRNGVLASPLAGGRLVAAVDGIEVFSSFHRCCDRCLERAMTVKEKGQEVSRVQYYHRMVVASLVGLEFPVPLGLELMRPGEDEVATAQRLLVRLRRALGCRFFEVLTLDALYLRPEFMRKVQALGWDWVATLKENQMALLAEAQRLTSDRPADDEEPLAGTRICHLWQTHEAYWETAGRSVRVIRSIEERVQVQRVGRQKQQAIRKSENVWVSSLSAAKVRAISVHRVGKVRWELETRLFGEMTSHWFLKHAAIHSPIALEALLLIRFMAYLLFMVFTYRQVYSHLWDRFPCFIELARWLYNSLEPSALPRLDSS